MLATGNHALPRLSAPRLLLPAALAVAMMILAAGPAGADSFRVLVVMSYDPGFPWTEEIRQGIDSELGDAAEATYFYMDTKNDLAGGPDKARQAFELFERLRPDGVIACDDNAQSMFVVPYLMDKTDTPVAFCGVNGDPAGYGYPASNVTGVKERLHLAESVAFAQQLDSSIRSICYMVKKSPTADALHHEVKSLEHTLPVHSLDFRYPSTLDEALTGAAEMRGYCDLLFVAALEGIPDNAGVPVPDRVAMPAVAKAFGGPTTGTSSYAIEAGLLCAVVKTGQEQGRVAAEKLLKAMRGTPVSDIPVGTNQVGRRLINVTEMRALGIVPKPSVLKGAELVRTP